VAVEGALALALAGMAVLAARRVLRLPQAEPPNTRGLALVVRLSALQLMLFTMVEVGERIGAREPVSAMFHHHLFLAGLVVQCLVASVGAAFLRWFGRVVDRFAASPSRIVLPRVAPSPPLVLPAPRVTAVPVLAGGTGLRSPPSR
jgi:hypothetical protein